MFWIKRVFSKKVNIMNLLFVAVIFTTRLFTACGQDVESKTIELSDTGASAYVENETAESADDGPTAESNGAGTSQETTTSQSETSVSQPGASASLPETSTGMETGASAGNSSKSPEDAAREKEIKELFGDNCIADQTFEVEFSEYDGKVWFVPYAPSADNRDFRMQIVQNGEVLKEITGFVPKNLVRKQFNSLDAVSFFDVNYDDITDIVLIETYGNITFAAVYYGHNDEYGFGPYFYSQEQLSENITGNVEPLTVPGIRSFLSDGKKNGSFSDYQEAYRAVGRLYEMEGSNERKYDLIYVDDDDIPELVAAVNGYFVSLYTYSDGKVYTLMDYWGYGAMGNSGYAYVPERNSLRNYNTDYAGAILYTTYMEVSRQKAIEISVAIKTYNFNDVNGNGAPDEDERASLGYYSVSYVDGEEITKEEFCSYGKGEYEYIEGEMRLEELLAELQVR